MTFERKVIPKVDFQYVKRVYDSYPSSPRVLLVYIPVLTSVIYDGLQELMSRTVLRHDPQYYQWQSHCFVMP